MKVAGVHSGSMTWFFDTAREPSAARTAGQLSGRVMPPRPMPETMTLVMNQVMP